MSFSEYTFEFLSGKYEGGRFRFPNQTSFSIGRDAKADFVLVEEMVSRFHAEISIKEEAILVADSGSSNGTYLNGQKIHHMIKILMEKGQNSIEKYKNRVKKPKPWNLINGKNRVQKAKP